MNLQICFVNDSGSDKDSDADDSKTETSLDTPLSPMVHKHTLSHTVRDAVGCLLWPRVSQRSNTQVFETAPSRMPLIWDVV